ncbi:MAG: hypothetical protein LBQ22_07020 [Bacteroidales bacterium]|jgi:hypothetical protein|nr:hypothetical protein [Bacteroidales bacterium]
MENQQENQQGNQEFKITVTYQSKSVAVKVVNPKHDIKETVRNIKKLAQDKPDKYWPLSEMNSGGQRITYLLGRINLENGKKEVFHEKNTDGEIQTLFDYGVKPGDNLILINKVIAG